MPIPENQTGQIVTVNLSGSAPAGALTCFVSHLIKRPFITRTWAVSFNLNQQRLVKHYLYVSPDDFPVAALPDSGFDVLSEHSPTSYLVGDDQSKIIHYEATMENGNGYLKVYAQNDDAFNHDVDVQITIDIF
jgi:hypothetical protein